MGKTLGTLESEIFDDLGDLGDFADSADIWRWLNIARSKMGAKYPQSVSITWTSTDLFVDLPDDFLRFDHLAANSSTSIPAYHLFGNTMRFLDSTGAGTAGGATLFYYSLYPLVTETDPSVMPDSAEEACKCYCLYRVFKRVASNRAEYRRFSTLRGNNSVDMDELQRVADGHFADYEEFVESIPLEYAETYFGD